MRVLSIIIFAICFISIGTVSAQTKSCSKAKMAACAKANNMTIAECAKKCPMASAYLAAQSEEQVDIIPVSLTAEQQTKVASALQSKEGATQKSYQCTKSKAQCSKSKASAKVATLQTEEKKKVARA